MIIKIEDAPNIKHIKIDINFDDDDFTVVTDTKATSKEPKKSLKQKAPKNKDIKLNLNEDYSVNSEVVEKPNIPDNPREDNISEDMVNAEF